MFESKVDKGQPNGYASLGIDGVIRDPEIIWYWVR